MSTSYPHAFTFGIYPGGIAGTEDGMTAGPPNRLEAMRAALDALQGAATDFRVRVYCGFTGTNRAADAEIVPGPAPVEALLDGGRTLDLVVCCADAQGRTASWTAFVREAIARFGPHLATVQVCEEPNLTHHPGDGRFFPHVVPAVIEGVLAARDEIERRGLRAKAGFNAVPSFDPADRFWTALRAQAPRAFLEALGYVALDFFPDVFRRVTADGTPGDLDSSVRAVLRHFRDTTLASLRIGLEIPLHIGETGWATGPGRPDERQAEVVERVARTVHALREDLHVDTYECFALRDADSSNPDFFHQFGLLRDDYSPKPAFERYRALVAELSDPRCDGARP